MDTHPIHITVRQVMRIQGNTYYTLPPVPDQVRDMQQYKEECYEKLASGEYNTTVGFIARAGNDMYLVTRTKAVRLGACQIKPIKSK